jgi:hypothetical protein
MAKNGFGKVYYNNLTRQGYPSFNSISVGKGYEGITVVKSMWDVIDEVDVTAFPDILDGSKQKWMRKQGYRVWGSGKADELEMYRLYWKQMVKALGLPVNPYVLVVGIMALREYLKDHTDRYVKISYMRGLMETYHHEEYWLSKPWIDEKEHKLGPLAEETEFIVEAPIKTDLEIGYDGLFVGRYPKIGINGVEVKDAGYVGMVQNYDEMPSEILETTEALKPVLAKDDYANLFAIELRVQKDGTAIPIDPCCRQGSPSGEAQLATWSNMPEIVFAGAHGELVEPEREGDFVAQAMIYNKGEETDWCPVKVPNEIRGDVNLYYGLRKGDQDWAVPQHHAFDEVGSVVAVGDSAEEAIDRCKEKAEQIGGNVGIKTESLDEALKQFDMMKKRGMSVEPISA